MLSSSTLFIVYYFWLSSSRYLGAFSNISHSASLSEWTVSLDETTQLDSRLKVEQRLSALSIPGTTTEYRLYGSMGINASQLATCDQIEWEKFNLALRSFLLGPASIGGSVKRSSTPSPGSQKLQKRNFFEADGFISLLGFQYYTRRIGLTWYGHCGREVPGSLLGIYV